MAESYQENTSTRAPQKKPVRKIPGPSEAAVPSVDWSEVPGWYTGPQEEDHRRATSQT